MAELKIAPLLIIDFARLLRHDVSEVDRLVEACRTLGFFYLDLQGAETESQTMLADWQGVLQKSKAYFSQSEEIKLRDDRNSLSYGYKPLGRLLGATEDKVDAFENLKIPRNEILEGDSNLPAVVRENLSLFRRFVSGSHFVLTTLLENLSNALGLQTGARFEDFNREREPSKTLISLLKYPKQNADVKGLGVHKHTDSGTLTFLFAEQWGLQTLLAGGWHYVEPRPGHAVINVGDMLRFLSGQQFYSCVHRVLPVTGRQEEHRYCVGYFMRAEDNAVFRDHEGKEMKAKEWHARKMNAYDQSQAEQALDTAITGGMEKNGVLLGRSIATT